MTVLKHYKPQPPSTANATMNQKLVTPIKANTPLSSFPILIVEDNPSSQKLLEKILNKAGYSTVSVENGRQALALFDTQFFPIVLTDWIMPEMNGPELCKMIRSKVSHRYVYIIFITSKNSKNDIVNGLEAGADDYVTKPFCYAELIARINTGIRILKLEQSLKGAYEEIKNLSRIDPLTGCYNRGYILESLNQEINRFRRYQRIFSVILCDIDHFKSVNDTYGHQTGDFVLKEFVRRISAAMRDKVDILGRYGGEEFLILLSETKFDGAVIVAERLREIVSGTAIRVGKHELQISASFGVCGFKPGGPTNDISADRLIRRTDEFLYLAKRNGRNRVEGRPF